MCHIVRIGIDARMYGPETAKGLGRYIERLIHHLEDMADNYEFVVFLRKENFDHYQPRSPRFKKVLADFPWYGWKEQVLFPRVIEQERVDLMHFPHFNVPLWYNGKFIVTIHDLILLQFPTIRSTTLLPWLFWMKYGAYRFVLHHAVKNAEAVITVSHATENDLLRVFRNLTPTLSQRERGERSIHVIYEGADSVETGQMKLPEETFERFGITRPYCLYVGNAYPHKNLERLLRVFNTIWEKTNGSYQLVLVGKHDYFYRRLQTNLTPTLSQRERGRRFPLLQGEGEGEVLRSVIFTNHVSQGFLADLYRNARMYVFPSLLEGFGLPGLEAMMYDLPVISSNKGALPEIYGDAALYFDPHDEHDMEEAITRGLTDEALRERLIVRGREQAAKYRWEKCAQETLHIYQMLRN